ncbi:hypothetical protein CDD81_979 [Ophiocordyceps australis]|uniref:Phosphatidic acid phosphatase type 2/haloperoxidase domain-containing protein n=1 Tax=Ophiocordyceps australis TaxID=1399860 RepID=A0A2C5Y037_9HYPO|nr:hypothetical protein CDD81_979 [Ophiocordyceps australis]
MAPGSSLPPGGDAAHNGPVPASLPWVQVVRNFVVDWLVLNWVDVVSMMALGGVTFGVYHSPVFVTRTFPISFNGTSGDIVYPQLAYPDRGWIIPSWLAGIISIGAPIVVYLAALFKIQCLWDATASIMGSIASVLLASLFQVTIKQLVGGFRPYFLTVCMPDAHRLRHDASLNRTGLNAVGYHQLMYSTDVCTQPDGRKLKNAITSFPSGHSTAAFAGFGFLFLWLNAKLKVWADHRPAFWKLALTMVPLLTATVFACILTVDAAHNWYDVLAGSVIGGLAALAGYRWSYAAVWDWRWNHVPLRRREPFDYEAVHHDGRLTLGRAAGWGGGGAGRRDSATSSSALVSFAAPLGGQDGGRQRRRAGVGGRAGEAA